MKAITQLDSRSAVLRCDAIAKLTARRIIAIIMAPLVAALQTAQRRRIWP